LAALMKRFCVFITPDSAPMHIASAMKTPAIALFGPTDPARHLVPSNGCVALCKVGEIKCKPCYKTTCQRKTSCMRMITVDEVFELVKKNVKAGHESAERIDSF
ncbi:MAG TPA: glycosyltransferase family 9 protein, partial [Candidatus Omnitrophota bacterium]|nr:glycosyltransferase family 9 protein [Candidatus Omnitrophota bacterium]